MTFIRITITILALTIFKVSAEGINLPIFYNLDNDWKTPDESIGYNNDRIFERPSGYWYNNFDTKSYKTSPSVVSNWFKIVYFITIKLL